MTPQREAPDSADLDAIFELEHSGGYRLIFARVCEMIQRKSLELEGDHGPEKTARLRGEIKALRDILTIPEVLKVEIKAAIKEKASKPKR